jgi:pimeloyl-ACP methyl ester carboxylesterase
MAAGGSYQVVDGLRLYCWSAGSGAPSLLLLHGFLFSQRSWQAVLPSLCERFSSVAVDLPGHGESDRPRAYTYSFDAQVHTLVGLLDAIGAGRVSIIGHSLGAGLALLLAARYPERVEKLVLVTPHVYPGPLAPEIRLALVPVLGELAFKRLFGRRHLQQILSRLVYLDPGLPTDEQLQFYWERLNRPGGRDAAYQVLLALARSDALAAAPPRVRCPVLLVRGERDRMVPEQTYARLAEELPCSELCTISGTRHAPMEERPDAFLQAVLPFLQSR